MKCKHAKMTMAGVKRATCFWREIGSDKSDIEMKFDKEAAIGTLVDDSEAMRKKMRTVVEYSPVMKPKSNGMLERSVTSVKKQVKVMKSGVQVAEQHQGHRERRHLVCRVLRWVVQASIS